jgi:UDP-N-acetylmuramoylalanine--D-glutamate ligase
VVLITGGTDKNIDFSPLADAVKVPRAIVLLSGTGTEKIRPLLSAAHVSADGPFDNLKDAVVQAIARAGDLASGPVPGASPEAGPAGGVSILFSPGCTSFGMFLNEFDRGRKFKEIAAALTSAEAFSP